MVTAVFFFQYSATAEDFTRVVVGKVRWVIGTVNTTETPEIPEELRRGSVFVHLRPGGDRMIPGH